MNGLWIFGLWAAGFCFMAMLVGFTEDRTRRINMQNLLIYTVFWFVIFPAYLIYILSSYARDFKDDLL